MTTLTEAAPILPTQVFTPLPTIIPITPATFLEAFREVVEYWGAETTLADADTIPGSEPVGNAERLLGRILRRHGVRKSILRALDDLLVDGDFNCTPSAPYHFAEGSRVLAQRVDDLDLLGWNWGSILDEMDRLPEASNAFFRQRYMTGWTA